MAVVAEAFSALPDTHRAHLPACGGMLMFTVAPAFPLISTRRTVVRKAALLLLAEGTGDRVAPELGGSHYHHPQSAVVDPRSPTWIYLRTQRQLGQSRHLTLRGRGRLLLRERFVHRPKQLL